MSKQVLVTGASGFVGSHLTEALEAQGYSVLAMTRHPDTHSGAGKPVFGDVYEPASLSQALADATPPITSCTRCHGRTSSRRTPRLPLHSEGRQRRPVSSG